MPTQPTDKMATELLHLHDELAANNANTDARKKKKAQSI